MRFLLVLWSLLIAFPVLATQRLEPKRSRVLTTANVRNAQNFIVSRYNGTGCGGTFAGSRGGTAPTCSRIGTAQQDCGGSLTALGANTCRVETDGILGDVYTSQYLLNNCGSPATQTVTLATGKHVLWMEGSGSLAGAVGTATATGLPCTATQGVSHDCAFNVTVGGTVGVTKTGTVTHAQLQTTGAYWQRTAKICCAGASCSQQQDTISIPLLVTVDDPEWTISGRFTPRVDWTTGAGLAWDFGTDSTANSSRALIGPLNAAPTILGADWYIFTTNASTYRNASVPLDVTRAHDIAFHYNLGIMSLWVDGVEAPTNRVTGASSTGIPTAFPAALEIAAGSSGRLRGWADKIQICKGSPKKCGLTNGTATSVACLGDSITRGGTISYPQRLFAGLGYTWGVGQHGVDGNTTTQMLARWRSDIRGKDYSWLVLLGGVNDINGAATAAATYANILTIVTEAKGAGMQVVLLTVLPFKNATGWSSAKQTELEALNVSIRGTSGVTVVDTYPQFEDPSNLTAMLVTYDSGDHLHPNQVGRDRLGALVLAAIPH